MQFDSRVLIISYDRDHIEAMVDIVDGENSLVCPGGSSDSSLFTKVNISQRSCEFEITASLDLDEAKGLAVERDNIDLAYYLHTARITSDRRFEGRHHYPIAFALQKFRR